MGGRISSDTVIADNEPLKKFSGPESISDNDPFWNKLLSFNLRIDDHDKGQLHDFDDSLNDFLNSLMYNTPTSGNFAAFIRVFLRLSKELKTSEKFENIIFLWQASNALIILRYICKFLTQRMTESEFVKTFASSVSAGSSSVAESENDSDCEWQYSNTAEKLLDTLIDILAELPVK
uniref:Dymeclin n=1 Tax=Angiostrongylus cantonensis TaxID=6313 RepID=A0A0K0D8M0_ANGCA